MAAPTPTDRELPDGIKLEDGHSTLITCDRNPTLKLWEKTVKPPGFDGGDSVEQTTMHTVRWREMAPRKLITLTNCTAVCAYDPAVLTELQDLINVESVFTVTHPDGTQWPFYGYIKSAEPAEHAEGTQPTMNVEIVPTNFDFINKVEAGPALVDVAGT